MVDPLSPEADRIFWKASADGRFTTKTAYHLSQPGRSEQNDQIWKDIWKLPTPERVRVFAWLVSLDRIATNVLRFCRRCSDSPMCARCDDIPETVVHVLRDCPPARFCWSRWVPVDRQMEFFHRGQEDWLRSNLSNEDRMESGLAWNEFFSIAIWLIWKNRCTACFKGVGKAFTAPTLAHSIQHKSLLWHKAWEAPSIKPGRPSLQGDKITELISWHPPSSGWRKLNIDGASAGNPGTAGAGGVIRDEQGRWIAGFVAKIGEATAVLAELWAFYHGLDLAWRIGCDSLVIETDSQLAIQLINNRRDPVHPYASLLDAIRRKLAQSWLVRVVHTYREGNRVADWLSKHSLVYPYGTHELSDPPRELIQILRDDVRGVSFERQVSAPIVM
ncbi:unnamed protein product [Linum trigynum]|uniref:RNase H type-1 domain-containing protein n=1 Tax=Linum trigynum TaxID=586398 RepID=A0AAV2F298_9ROSI